MQTKEATNNNTVFKIILSKFGIFPILLLFVIGFSIISPNFRTFNNMMNIFRSVSINLVIATGMTLVILTGGIDLSVGSIVALSGVVALRFSVTNPGFAIPAALLVGVFAGLINGVLIAFVGLPPFIATLGSMTYLRGIAFLLCNGNSIINNKLPFAWIGNSYLGPFPWLAILALLIFLLGWFLLRGTTYGRRIYAVGGNVEASKNTGIRVWSILLSVYALSGLCAALSGVMISSRLYSANGLLGQGYEMDAIAATILGGTSFSGGKGNLTGTIIGALIIGVLNTGLTISGVSYYWQQVVKGIVIILAVVIDIVRNKISE
ncbi:Ribose transport system permease protein RbsC [uncultured spirochete]|jgi:ribose transport system permease protein|uniref:Ribose transport system permease protein RbsC n=1 Tax=uncultured spirochete TaxID=156406 RepID=A0A3P3XQ65_9SPIR|nr:Ribose transport system permease protein RbsC [uncultured spirochete]